MPQFDVTSFLPQLVWLGLTFLVLYLLMWRVALPRITDVLETRSERIASDLDKAAELKAQADSVLAEYETALAEARTRAKATLAEVTAAAAAAAEARNTEVTERLNKEAEAAAQRIAEAKTQAMAEVRDVAVELAQASVTKLIGQDVAADQVAGAVDTAMKEAG